MQTRKLLAALTALAVTGSAGLASAQTLNIELGVRETGNDVGIGNNGGASGAIELVGGASDRTLPLDGSTQTLTYTFGEDPVRPFTGDGSLDGTWGTIENLWIVPDADVTAGVPITLYIDDITFFDASEGTTTTITGFEAFTVGDEVMFQEPTFSGSSAGRLETEPDIARVTDAVAFSGDQSYEVEFAYATNPDGPLLLRLTTFATDNLPNPAIMLDAGDQVSFTISGIIPEPASLGLLGLGMLGLLRRR